MEDFVELARIIAEFSNAYSEASHPTRTHINRSSILAETMRNKIKIFAKKLEGLGKGELKDEVILMWNDLIDYYSENSQNQALIFEDMTANDLIVSELGTNLSDFVKRISTDEQNKD